MSVAASDRRRFRAAVAAIDRLHAGDPRHIVWRGRERPFELVYGWRMCTWRRRLAPGASEVLRLAVRAQHLCRWLLPRAAYPDGRSGYLAWRREQARRHGERLADMLSALGYDDALVARSRELVTKRGLGHDPEVQVLEDCAALTYLELEHASLAARTDPARMQRILARTMAKVSPAAARVARELL